MQEPITTAASLETPIVYNDLLDYLFDTAAVSFSDWQARPFDLHLQIRATTDMGLLYGCSLSQDSPTEHKNQTLRIWVEFEQWCESISKQANPYFQPNQTSEEKLLLKCGDTTCMQFSEICSTYHITPLKMFTSTTQHPPCVEHIVLPALPTTLHIKLKAVLKTMYVDAVRTLIASAYNQECIACKIPLDSLLSVTNLRSILQKNENWEDASLFLLLSSNDLTLSVLLEAWPFASEFPEVHLRKVNHYQTLLRTQFLLSHPMRAFRAACVAHDDFADAFLTFWAIPNWQFFCATLQVTDSRMLNTLLKHFAKDHEFVRLLSQRLMKDASDFKNMACILLRSTHSAPLTCDFASIAALDVSTLNHLLQLAY